MEGDTESKGADIEQDIEAIIGALGFEIGALKVNLLAIGNQIEQLKHRINNIYKILEKVSK